MKRSNTHRKPILLYCSQPTQAQDDSEAEISDFPPCRERNSSPPNFSHSPVTVLSHPCHPQAAASSSQQRLIVSSEEELPQSQHRQQLNKGLGKTNVVNMVDAIASVPHTKGNPPIQETQSSTTQDLANERPLKRRRLNPRDDDSMRWVRHEIAGLKDTLEEMASEAREDRKNLNSTLEELDIAGVKESLEEIIYEAREERHKLSSMLEELLAEIQQKE